MKTASPIMQFTPLLFALLLAFGPLANAAAVAEVNGSPVTSEDLQHALQEFAASRGADPSLLRQSPQFPQLRDALLRSLIERELLWQAAREHDAASDSQVAEAVARLRTQLGGEQRFQHALQAQGLTEKLIAERLRHDLSIQAYLQKEVYAGVEVSDSDIRDFYQANRGRYRSPDLLHIKDILLAQAAGSDPKTLAEQIRAKITHGAEFSYMARKQSTDISARDGGDLGFVNAEDLGGELAPVVAALKPGEVSDPHAGPGGIHILQLISRRPGIQASLADVHDMIRDQLLETRREQALQARLQQLRAAAKITIPK